MASLKTKAPVLAIYLFNEEVFILGEKKSYLQFVRIIDLVVIFEMQVGGGGKDIYHV